MEKDYSEYQISDSDRYKILRSNRKSVVLDFFNNSVRFYPEDRVFRIRVDQGNEYHTMQEFIDEYEEEESGSRKVDTLIEALDALEDAAEAMQEVLER